VADEPDESAVEQVLFVMWYIVPLLADVDSDRRSVIPDISVERPSPPLLLATPWECRELPFVEAVPSP
jgi:hypothetical protein